MPAVERFLPELFTFVAEPRASADNNAAERSLRPPVVSRKISGGTRSERGSETKSILASFPLCPIATATNKMSDKRAPLPARQPTKSLQSHAAMIPYRDHQTRGHDMKSIARSHLPFTATLGLLAILVITSVLFSATPAAAQGETNEPPAQPTGLTGNVAHDRVSLSWDDPQDDTITGYQILRRNKAVDDPGVFHVHVENTGSAATSYTDSDVQAETRYVYRIKARNAAGLSPQSSYFNADTPVAPEEPDTGPPAKPTGLTGGVEHNRVSLRWDNPGDSSITSYQILRRDRAVHGEGKFIVLDDDTGSAGQSHVDNSVQPENKYVYRIRARNAAGLSPRSGYFNAGTPAAPPPPEPESQDPPAQPTGLTSAVTHDSVALRWDDPQDDSITGYRVLRLNRAEDDLGEFHIHVSNTGSAAASYLDSDVEPETRYVYRIKALNAQGASPRSGYTNADTPAAPAPPEPQVPSAPTGLDAVARHDSVTLSWTDPEDASITGYLILRGPDADNLATIVEDTGNAEVSYTDETVEPDTTYVYAIKALNAQGASPRSGYTDADTPAAPVPAAPTNLFTAASHNQVLLNWGDPDDDSITGYRILRGPDADSLTTLVEDTGSAATSYTDDSVEPETTYVYALRARNSSGESDRSETARVTTTAAPADEEPLVTAKQVAEISLVSNTAETSTSGFTIAVNFANNKVDFATSFHTGNNPDGYALTSAQVLINRTTSSPIPEVFIFSDSSGSPGTNLHTLTNPSDLPFHTDQNTSTLTTFTAPANATLTADTTYWVVLKVTDTGSREEYRVRTTESDDETSDDSPEWEIGDATYKSENNAAWSEASARSIQMNIQGRLINPPGVSEDLPANKGTYGSVEIGGSMSSNFKDRYDEDWIRVAMVRGLAYRISLHWGTAPEYQSLSTRPYIAGIYKDAGVAGEFIDATNANTRSGWVTQNWVHFRPTRTADYYVAVKPYSCCEFTRPDEARDYTLEVADVTSEVDADDFWGVTTLTLTLNDENDRNEASFEGVIGTHGDTDSFRIDARGAFLYGIQVKPEKDFFTCIRGIYRVDSLGNLTKIEGSGHCLSPYSKESRNIKFFGNDDSDNNDDFVVVVGANEGTGRYSVKVREQPVANQPPPDDFFDDDDEFGGDPP